MAHPISLNNCRMHVAQTAAGGVVNAETFFVFSQDGEVVSAQYSGGGIRLGYLVGLLKGNQLKFRYTQLQTDGCLDGGSSNCEIERLADGRIRLLEHFQWESREGSGTNIFLEVR